MIEHTTLLQTREEAQYAPCQLTTTDIYIDKVTHHHNYVQAIQQNKSPQTKTIRYTPKMVDALPH